ncbi:DUF742 domain-containing protein [Nocardia nova]|uniref:DUF742 domain-containing protein n=1 Tax=Nocardia nova TaxID=37330 RepID=UPI002B4B591E|nr:DUF742 domain-containing protein [Nocardia nova]
MTSRRTRDTRPELDMITLVFAVHEVHRVGRIEREYLDIVRLCRTPQSVAEVAALLGLPLTLAKILIGDLIADGHLITRSAAALPPTDLSELDLLRTVLDGIRKL